jgi:DNA helicase-2/ATP-dependent DNA helicase PcrA
MNTSPILAPLNEAQREAVTASPGHVLVLAGAGSGKTRVLVHRVAWLLESCQIPPSRVLAVTFTNKAAVEMRERIEMILQRPLGGMWVGTFHGLAHRMLRIHWREAGLPETFQILDSEDQLRTVRRVVKVLNLDEARWPAKQAQGYINARKEEGLRPANLQSRGDPWLQQMSAIYREYEASCQRSGLVDFSELLLRVHELLRENTELLAHYRQHFQHILVDEFQDTNTIQYAWLQLLAGESGSLFMVGDDDQSIYSWRGARIENIQRFPHDFPAVATYRLEKNYRSTANILAAANAVIANNQSRLGKQLWTDVGNGDPLHLYAAFNELDEARFVIGHIQQWVEQGGLYDDLAVLYRISAQSRALEEALVAERVPYRVHGGQRFYERAEIKDALGYLRLVAFRDDDAAFERVANTPPRSIGPRSMESLREVAREQGVSLWQAAQDLVSSRGLSTRASSAIKAFLDLVQHLSEVTAGQPLDLQVETVIRESGLLEHFKRDKTDRSQTRPENLAELVNAAKQFDGEASGAENPLTMFLAHAALEAGEGRAQANGVHLMTLHAAKGIEFPVVFLCGLEEGLFPHRRSIGESSKLEEERRLCYVGMTRAKQMLYLSYTESRRMHRTDYMPEPSRFIREIPAELVQEVRLRSHVTWQRYAPHPEVQGVFPLGQRVAHKTFGEGVVLNYEGRGTHTRIQVNFQRVGTKWLVLAYANLKAVDSSLGEVY